MSRLGDFWALTKPGITRHVIITAAAGYWLGSGGDISPARLAWLLAGTALVSGGTNGLNQWWERDVDARMPRTRQRPMASGRIAPREGLLFALAIGIAGSALLAAATNALTAALAALTLLSYVLAYTPLKKRTSLNTLVGAVPGALPILGGWTAASGSIEPGALVPFALLYCWQLPHTLALAWMHRASYAAGGLRMPGYDDDTGRRTALKALAWMLPLAAAAAATSGTIGLAFTVALTLLALRWVIAPHARLARQTFIGTILYLPAVLVAAVM